MFKTVLQVRKIIKAIKKSKSLLAVHLSYTPIIQSDKGLQTYIRKKLQMYQLISPPKCDFSTNEVLKDRLQKDWILRDKLQSECNVVEKISEYYRNLRVSSVSSGSDGELILQRTIGYSSMIGNEQWIARNECYVCDRWLLTFFLYKPESQNSQRIKSKTPEEDKTDSQENEGSDGSSMQEDFIIEEEIEEDQYFISGSWESLMMSYGGTVPGPFKMLPIRDFMNHFDRDQEYGHLSWEDYQ